MADKLDLDDVRSPLFLEPRDKEVMKHCLEIFNDVQTRRQAEYDSLVKKFREVFGPAGFKSVSKMLDERDLHKAQAVELAYAIDKALEPIDMGLGLLPSSAETKNLIAVLANYNKFKEGIGK